MNIMSAVILTIVPDLKITVTDKKNKNKVYSLDLSEEENRGFQTVGEFDFPKGVVKIKLSSPQNNGYFRFSAARFTQLSAEPTPDIWEGTPKPTYQPPDGTVIVHIYDGKDPRQNIGFYETKGDWSGSKGQEETFHIILTRSIKKAIAAIRKKERQLLSPPFQRKGFTACTIM